MITPIGILKKKKLDFNENENNEKRFCFDQDERQKFSRNDFLELNDENQMRNMILENVNLCVENLSKILSESCSNTKEQLTTLSHAKFFQVRIYILR